MDDGIGSLSDFVSNNIITHTMLIREYDLVGCSLGLWLATLLLGLLVCVVLVVGGGVSGVGSCGLRSFLERRAAARGCYSFLWSPNVLAAVWTGGWWVHLSLVDVVVSASWCIWRGCLWWDCALVWISLCTKSVRTMASCPLNGWAVAYISYLWLEEGTFWVLMNSWTTRRDITSGRGSCARGGSARWWNKHIMHMLLFTAGRCLPTLSCSVFLTIFIEIERLTKSRCMHVVRRLWIYSAMLWSTLSYH